MSQHTYKALALGAVLGFLVSVVPSCGSSGGNTTCGPSNCSTGCCNAGKCVTATNTNNLTCGTAGLSCVDCTKTTGSSCVATTFKCSTGGSGGGAGGGSGATCAQSCNGCCDASGACQAGTAGTACGSGGATCSSCASPATCSGNVCKDASCPKCTKSGACQTTLSDTACGNGGIACLDCAASGGATCNTTSGVCTGGSCTGCRDSSGACLAGNTKGACGTSGTCTACSGTQICSNGACVSGSGGGAGGGGGSSGGTCPGGAPCSTGCCSGGTCIATTFQSATNCGINAAACASCQSGQLCAAGVCGGSGGGAGTGGGAGGGPAAGSLGSACTADNDCTGITLTSTETSQGFKAFCKKTLNPQSSIPYIGGMCTRRCVAADSCGTGNFCDYIDGPYGEIDNICLRGCPSGSPCRDSYKCYNYGTTAAPLPVCYPGFADGGDIGPFDPGPGNSANPAARPCTDDTMCAPQTPAPALGFCILPTTPDGGPSGFLNGACSAQCNTSLSDAWCGTNGNCNGFIGATTSTGPSVTFLCQQGCPTSVDGGPSTCLTGYVCNGGTNGSCIPRCDNAGRPTCAQIDPAKPTCNATTGLCGT